MATKNKRSEIERMFNAYCLNTIKNARNKITRDNWKMDKAISLDYLTEIELVKLLPSMSAFVNITYFETPIGRLPVNNDYIAESLFNLTEYERNIILLYYFARFTDEEISNILDMKRYTITKHRNKALSKMGEFLVKEFGFHAW